MPYIIVDGLAQPITHEEARAQGLVEEGAFYVQPGSTGSTGTGVEDLSLADLIAQFTSAFQPPAAPTDAERRADREANRTDLRAELAAIYPFIPEEILGFMTDRYIDHGDPTRALAEARQSDLYETYFPGIRREDGSLRYTEQGYASYVERAQLALASVNINPDLFGNQIVEALAAGVQIQEFEQRIDSVYERVIDRAPEVRQFYASQYGIEGLSDSAIIASMLDPDVGSQILEGRLTNAEIGGEAALRGFGIDLSLADRLRERGLDQTGASELFSQAAEQLPVLDVLARRHNDPDDDFNLDEFLSASIFDDPTERRRIRRLVTQERALFTGGAPFARTRTGTVGLQVR